MESISGDRCMAGKLKLQDYFRSHPARPQGPGDHNQEFSS
jgi:hypothetical protein